VLRVTVEIWPGGEPRRARVLATAFIANVSDLEDISNYTMRVSEGVNPVAGTPAWKAEGEMRGHDRRASVWSLVAKIAAWAAEQRKAVIRRSTPEDPLGYDTSDPMSCARAMAEAARSAKNEAHVGAEFAAFEKRLMKTVPKDDDRATDNKAPSAPDEGGQET
jgi:hypothetical protein